MCSVFFFICLWEAHNIFSRKKLGCPRKCWMTYGGRPQEDEHPKSVSKDPRSKGLLEDCKGGQGSQWTVTPDMMMMT
jgi:hypothetical protein